MAKYYSSLADYPGPNTAPAHQWATFIIDRKTQFKVHENRGHALNALKDVNAGILYKWSTVGLQWIEKLRIDRDPNEMKVCENCDAVHSRHEYNDAGKVARYIYISSEWIDMKAEVPTLAFLCTDCSREARRSKVKKGA